MKLLYRCLFVIVVAGALFSCTETSHDKRAEIVSLIKRHTNLDVSGFGFSIVKDDIGEFNDTFLCYTRVVNLQFERADLILIQKQIQATPHYNKVSMDDIGIHGAGMIVHQTLLDFGRIFTGLIIISDILINT